MKINAVRLCDRAGDLSQSLGHKARLQTDVGSAHVALDLRLGNKRRNGVDDYNVNSAAAHKRLADFKRLLAGVRLRNEKIVYVDAEILGVNGVKSVLRVDKRGFAAQLLNLSNAVQSDSRFTGGFGTVYLGDPSAGDAADAESHVESHGTGGDRGNVHSGVFAHFHDGSLAEILLKLRDRGFERLLFLLGRRCRRSAGRCRFLFSSHDQDILS